MPTFTGVSQKGLQFVGQTGAGENLILLYDTRALSLQQFFRKATLIAYQRPSYVPSGLSSIHVGHSGLYYGATSLIIVRLAASLPTFIQVHWRQSGIPYRIDTGFTS